MLYALPVLFLLAEGSFTTDFVIRLPEPAVGCVAHYHSLSGPIPAEVHFECYTEEGKIIHRYISGVQKA